MDLRKVVIEYLGGQCEYCGTQDTLEIHHIMPLYAGGKDSMGNLEVACRDCHNRLHAQLIKLYPITKPPKGEVSGRALAEQKIKEKAQAVMAIQSLIEQGKLSKDSFPALEKYLQ